MWFKNLYLFQFEKPFQHSAEQLHDELLSKPFADCTSTQRESAGWVAPLGKKTESLVHAANGFILLTMANQQRVLPASVVREELDERVEEIQDRDSRRVGAKEKKEIRERIEDELLPRAFTRTEKLDAYIDPKGGWLVINTASAKKAVLFCTLLRKTIGSLPVVPVRSESLRTIMSTWLSNYVTPENFEIGDECELKSSGEDRSVAVFRKHELGSDEVKANLEAGKQVSKLALLFDKRLSFVLDDGFGIKKLKFLDVIQEQMNEQDPQTHEERMDIEFTLMTGEIALLLASLVSAVGSEVEVKTDSTALKRATHEEVDASLDKVRLDSSEEPDPSFAASEKAIYDTAVDLCRKEVSVSISFIQRHLKIGYNRAARIVEKMEQSGVVSPVNYRGQREVLPL